MTQRRSMARNPEKTRESLLDTAYIEMHIKGFQGMRVDEVLKQSKLPKGAFYHHFKSKSELAYEVLEVKIRGLVDTLWIAPLLEMDNFLIDFPEMLEGLNERMPALMSEHGCPLNNLSQEMSALDEGFQKRLSALFDEWIKAFSDVISLGQKKGYIRTDIESFEVACFLVSTIEGCIGMHKAGRSTALWNACNSQLSVYLKSLKAV